MFGYLGISYFVKLLLFGYLGISYFTKLLQAYLVSCEFSFSDGLVIVDNTAILFRFGGKDCKSSNTK